MFTTITTFTKRLVFTNELILLRELPSAKVPFGSQRLPMQISDKSLCLQIYVIFLKLS